MNTLKQIDERREYWKMRKDDFLILLDNWSSHQNVTLSISKDTIYQEYLTNAIPMFPLSQYKYGKDLQEWFDFYFNEQKEK